MTVRMLLAGGAGFLGSHLAGRLLEQGHSVVVLDNLLTGRLSNLGSLERSRHAPRLEILVADACDLRELEGPLDAVLHLASPASPIDYLRHPVETLDAGAVATRRLLDLAHQKGARFLLASTSEVYGDPLEHPQTERYWGNVNPVGPRSVYDEAKRFAEALATAYARQHGVTVRIARIFNTYGPGMRLRDGRIIPTFITQAMQGQPLTVFGDGSQTRSYCYVDDLVAGLDTLLWSEVEGPVNLGNPDEHSVLETARQVIALTGSRSAVTHRPLPEDDPRCRRPDIGRARRLLGWEAATPFEAGLRRTIEDIAERLRRGETDAVPSPAPHRNGNGAAHASRVVRVPAPTPGATASAPGAFDDIGGDGAPRV